MYVLRERERERGGWIHIGDTLSDGHLLSEGSRTEGHHHHYYRPFVSSPLKFQRCVYFCNIVCSCEKSVGNGNIACDHFFLYSYLILFYLFLKKVH